MFKKYKTLAAAISSLGESPPKKWLVTINLPTGLLYDNYGTTWDNAPRWGQRRYLERIFRRFFGKQFPNAILVYELTNIKRNVHLHAICDSPFNTIDQYKDWYYDLRCTSTAVKTLDPCYKAVDVRPIHDYNGLISDYLLKDPYGECYTYKYDGRPFKVPVKKLIKPLKECSDVIKNIDHGIILDIN